ncbi:hypothetical protein [Streptomyces sp. NPDC056255]|uniref:hypothetical protein n=1 Tax=Streptomyces sp. NPDC056255 TaxID=3345764 RepID=UPI0035DB9923
MSGPGGISDLDKNRALVEWLEWQLRKARNRVRELEVREEQERRRRERAHAAPRWSRARRIGSVEFPTKVALAQAVPVLPDGPGWWYEPKCEGSPDT